MKFTWFPIFLSIAADWMAAGANHLRGLTVMPAGCEGTCQTMWGQCGGMNWNGPTCCESGTGCVEGDAYYSQCKPGAFNECDAFTTTTTSTLGCSGSCQAEWAQCGGMNWNGPTCCVTGTGCVFGNAYYSQCQPGAFNPCDAFTTTTTTTLGCGGPCQTVWGQCAGVNWNGPNCCVAGTGCVFGNEYYSQCQPDAFNACDAVTAAATTATTLTTATATTTTTVTAATSSTSTATTVTPTTETTTTTTITTTTTTTLTTALTTVTTPSTTTTTAATTLSTATTTTTTTATTTTTTTATTTTTTTTMTTASTASSTTTATTATTTTTVTTASTGTSTTTATSTATTTTTSTVTTASTTTSITTAPTTTTTTTSTTTTATSITSTSASTSTSTSSSSASTASSPTSTSTMSTVSTKSSPTSSSTSTETSASTSTSSSSQSTASSPTSTSTGSTHTSPTSSSTSTLTTVSSPSSSSPSTASSPTSTSTGTTKSSPTSSSTSTLTTVSSPSSSSTYTSTSTSSKTTATATSTTTTTASATPPSTSSSTSSSTSTSTSTTTTTRSFAGPYAIAGFSLVDASSDAIIASYDPLESGAVLELGKLPSGLNIVAHAAPAVQSVRFQLRLGTTLRRVENAAPFALWGDANGDYHDWSPKVGSYELTATGWSAAAATGESGESLTIQFTVIEGTTATTTSTMTTATSTSTTTRTSTSTRTSTTTSTSTMTSTSSETTVTADPYAVTSFSLIDVASQSVISTLENEAVLYRDEMSSLGVNVEAITGSAVESVVFYLAGPELEYRVESIVPYALKGDINGGGIFRSWIPSLGEYTLSAIGFSGNGGSGISGTPLTIVFKVL